MAFPTTLVITLLTITAATSATNAASLLSSGILGGVITCTNTSVALAGTYNVVPQAKVDLVCGPSGGASLPAIIQSTQTNAAGLYSFVVTALDTVLLDGGKCYLNVTLPPKSCTFNLPTAVAVLRIPVLILSTIDALVGKILVLVPGAVSYVLSV